MTTLAMYLKNCREFGVTPKLPAYFNEIEDRNLYKPSMISEITHINEETARRWFREGKLQNESASNTYKIFGSDLKEFLFNRPNVIGFAKKANPEMFSV
jgi:hypothetical protein